MTTNEVVGLTRRNTVRNGGGGTIPRPDVAVATVEPPAPKNESLQRKFREFSRVNPFELAKSFTQVKDKEIYTVMQDLERALDPKVCHFDIVVAAGCTVKKAQQESTWRAFTRLLGEKLSKREFQMQSRYLAKNGRAPSKTLEGERISISKNVIPAAETDSDDNREEKSKRVIEFLKNEQSCLRKLEWMDEFFVQRLDPSRNGDTLMKAETFKKIFEGFESFVALHKGFFVKLSNIIDTTDVLSEEEICNLERGELLTAESIAEAMISLCDERAFDIYSQFFRDQEERCNAIKEEYSKNEAFAELSEEAAQDPRSGRQLLNMVVPIIMQQLTRYPLQFKAIIENTYKDSDDLPTLRRAYDKIHETLNRLEMVQKIQVDGTHSLRLYKTVHSCDPTVANAERIFIMKMAAYEVERGEANFSKRITFYLYNDLIVAARKRRGQKGKFEKDSHSGVTHDFMFSTPIDGTTVRRLDVTAKVRKNATKTFGVDLSPTANVLQNDRCVKYASYADEVCGSFILVPKKQEKLNAFLEKFTSAEHQLFLSSNPLCCLLINRISG
jgi:hypothetical protein